MFEAAQRAEVGDLPYFVSTRQSELTYLIAARDEDGRTLAHIAARNGHCELLEVLARAGAGKVVNKADDEVRQRGGEGEKERERDRERGQWTWIWIGLRR